MGLTWPGEKPCILECCLCEVKNFDGVMGGGLGDEVGGHGILSNYYLRKCLNSKVFTSVINAWFLGRCTIS